MYVLSWIGLGAIGSSLCTLTPTKCTRLSLTGGYTRRPASNCQGVVEEIFGRRQRASVAG
ncbi:hypothetical protein PF005_g7864 [Phytophthora fragariae]|uniref:RxLR effector protein n=2 Tax=Phytophthora TaxID=4783 RepID=A0A6A3S9X4_9STRA|nr:hypothetical protein PF003_g31920 [Phytophthora fragariae]KAE9037193.1 hypothetical protein PR002_g6705 [Phytophthora rubi]KAE8936326.1 hypothetical protein PF009_g13745 [Phytophthora fragariae]KAE9039470.1 hypothetical protein PR001_g7485 [Phytophthora rubi]KAE9107774.1 hypothetical protein PF010_g12153 [Phytophthora fragariae]